MKDIFLLKRGLCSFLVCLAAFLLFSPGAYAANTGSGFVTSDIVFVGQDEAVFNFRVAGCWNSTCEVNVCAATGLKYCAPNGQLYRDNISLGSFYPGDYKFHDSGLAPGTTYTYKLVVTGGKQTCVNGDGGEICSITDTWSTENTVQVIAGEIHGTLEKDMIWDASYPAWTISHKGLVVSSGHTITATSGAIIDASKAQRLYQGIMLEGNAAFNADGAILKNLSIVGSGGNAVMWDGRSGVASIKNSTLESFSVAVQTLNDINTFSTNSGSNVRVYFNNYQGLTSVGFNGAVNVKPLYLTFGLLNPANIDVMGNANINEVSISCSTCAVGDATVDITGNTNLRLVSIGSVNSDVTIRNNHWYTYGAVVGVSGVTGNLLIEGNQGKARYSLSNMPAQTQGKIIQVRNNIGVLNMKLDNVSYATIENNTIPEGLDYGIWILKGKFNVIRNNALESLTTSNGELPSVGIHVGGASSSANPADATDNQIVGNTVKGWFRTSVSLAGDSNIVRDNVFLNYGGGVIVGGVRDLPPVTVNGNSIYNNRFESIYWGEKHAKVLCTTCTNSFNTTKTAEANILGGPYTGGNYWNDYTGLDGDNDWIGDTPYVISGNVQDNYPLLYDIVVNTATDEADGDISDGRCDTNLTTAGEQCTLRAAIAEANARPGDHFIGFRIPSSGTPVISLNSPLPAITKALTINGATQAGGMVLINGAKANADCGILITADRTTVRGLIVGNFWREGGGTSTDHGICIDGGKDNIIENSYIGTTGTLDLGNYGNGIHITRSTGNIIRANVVAGNKNGIWIESDGNKVTGNFIGTNKEGTKVIGNQGDGIQVYSGGGNTIGGSTPEERNIIAGNLKGIWVDLVDSGSARPNIITGNYIGLNKEGNAFLSNTNGVGAIETDASGKTVYRQRVGILVSESPGTIIKDNVVSGNVEGVALMGAKTSGVVVTGNRIGTSADGMFSIGNSADGLLITAGGRNVIGGNGEKDGNIVSANKGHGITIGASADILPGRAKVKDGGNNIIKGNYIGVDSTGMLSLGNEKTGIAIFESPGNVIGGAGAGEGNVISANKGGGIFIIPLTQSAKSNGTVIRGNLVGVSKDGRLPLGNGGSGITVGPEGTHDTQIGGGGTGMGNVISGNGGDGIALYGRNAVVQGNIIGANQTGTEAIANSGNGITVSTDGDTFANIIGGSVQGARNIISGNRGCGILIGLGRHISVIGNYIGVQADGKSPLGNNKHGIEITGGLSRENRVGGIPAEDANVIAYNGGHGVLVWWGNTNSILGNAIYQNVLEGIRLSGYGPFYNDEKDPDSGPNKLQNYPLILSSVNQGGATVISGLLQSIPGSEYRIELFSNSRAESGGAYEGETFLNFVQVRTDSEGNAFFQTTVPVSATHVTATATDSEGNTSAFSPGSNIVDSTEDLPDADPSDGKCDIGNGRCTLRAAIQEMNRSDQHGMITFALPEGVPPIIELTSPLPELIKPVKIDGSGTDGKGRIEIKGGRAGSGTNGLTVKAKGIEVRNITVSGFDGNGIAMMNDKGTLSTLRLSRVDISDNAGAGIKGAPDTHLEIMDGKISGNGAGGIVNGNWIDAKRIQVSLNKKGASTGPEAGDGIHTKVLRMWASTVADNEGDGVEGGYLEIESSDVRENGGFGINAYIGPNLLSRITDTKVLFNGTGGIYAKLIRLKGVEVSGNRKGSRLGPEAGDGVHAESVVLINSSASNNEGDGVQALLTLSLTGSIIQNNLEYGIICSKSYRLMIDSTKVLRNGKGGISAGYIVQGGLIEVNDNKDFGIRAYNVRINGGTICGNGGYGVMASNIGFSGVKICENKVSGFLLYNYSVPQSIPSSLTTMQALQEDSSGNSYLTGCSVTGNQGDGIIFEIDAPFKISNSNIYGNTGYAINNRSQTAAITAKSNWWGDQVPPPGIINGNVDTSDTRNEAIKTVVTKAEDIAGVRGASTKALFYVSNLSQSEGVFRLTAADSLGWAVTPQSMTKTIGPGATEEVALTVSVPFNASAASPDTVTLTAALEANPSGTASADLKIAVKSVVINEVDPSGGWVELFNPGPGDLSLTGWRIKSGDGNVNMIFPGNSLITGGGYLVVHLSPADTADTQGLDLYAKAEQKLPLNGGSLALISPDLIVIDFVKYGDSTDTIPAGAVWSGTNPTVPQSGQSIGRNSDSLDTDTGKDWLGTGGTGASAPTPGAVNAAGQLAIDASGSSAIEKSYTVRNSGTGPVQIGIVSIDGAGAADLNISSDTCSLKLLDSSATCSIQIIYVYGSAGTKSAQLIIPSDGGSSVVDIVGWVPGEKNITLKQGWNFMSLPAWTSDPLPVEDVIRSFSEYVRIIWSYDNADKKWMRYKPLVSDNQFSTLEAGRGYWVYMSSTADLTITGTDVSPNVRLHEGWNLTGYGGTDGISADTSLSSLSGKWTIIWGWENGEWYAKQSSSLNSITTQPLNGLYKGKAYWIKMNNLGDWAQ